MTDIIFAQTVPVLVVIDIAKARHERRDRLEGHGKALAERDEDQISMTDPDARAMHSSSQKRGLGRS